MGLSNIITSKSNRTSKQEKPNNAGEYAKVVLKNAYLPVAKAFEKGTAAATSANQALKYDSPWTKPVIVPLAATAGGVYGAGVGTASALKRAYKGAKNLKDNEALKKLGSKAQNAPGNIAKTAGDKFNKMRENLNKVTADIPGAISSALSHINLS